MFIQLKKVFLSGGMSAHPPLLHSLSPRDLAIVGLVLAALACFAWWCYLAALSLSAAHHLQTIAVPVMQPTISRLQKIDSVPIVAVAGNQPQDTSNYPSTTSLKINNENIAIPANGSVSKTIQNIDGGTSVDISVTSSSSGSENSSSSTNIQVNSSSKTLTSSESEEK